MKKIVLIIISFLAIASAKSQTLTVTVTVNNVKSNKGVVTVCIFNKETGFPEKANLAYKCVNTTASKGTMQIKIEGIAAGNYAIAAYHDENSDGKVNTNFLGIPKEAAGASNGAKGKMGPPKFDDGIVTIDKTKTQITILLE